MQMKNSADQFEALVCEYYEPLLRFALSLTRSEPDAWDLAQQTFHIWAKKGHQLRDISKAKTWLFTTMHRAFLVGRRRQARFAHQDLDQISEQLPAPSAPPNDELDSGQVLSALAQVDGTFQAAVSLFYLDNCSYQEIAAVLEVPVGTVKSRIARGIAQLREVLLSGTSRCSSRQMDEDASVPNGDEIAAPPRSTASASCSQVHFAAEGVQTGSAERGFSSSPLRELSAGV